MEHQAQSSLFHSTMILKRKTGYDISRTVKRRTDYYLTTTVMDVLDDNLLVEILTRLPAKTVARLKVMNKRWYSLICDPFFVSKHTGLQSNRDVSSFFSTCSVIGSIVRLSIVPSSPTLVRETISLGLPEQFQPDLAEELKHRVVIITCCHGLLLVSHGCFPKLRYNSMYIINPITKKNQYIPPYPVGELRRCFGLAVRPMSTFPFYSHYKVVCMVRSLSAYEFKIFTLEMGYWRDSKATVMISNCGPRPIDIMSKPVYFRGALHWLSGRGYIIAFDVDKEESWMIEIPNSITKMATKSFPFWSSWFGVVEDEVTLVVVMLDELVILVLHDYENNKWKIKRPLENMGRICNVSCLPLFFDGERLLLQVPIFYQGSLWKYNWQLHNIRTGIAGPLSDIHRAGLSDCYPAIGTLNGV